MSSAKSGPWFRDLVAIRLLNAWALSTFFQPDEFFQSLEPAWRLAFGPDSGAWITWEWHHQLRSSLHPAIFAGGYLAANALSKLLPQTSPVRATILIATPRILQAVFAALGDWFTLKLGRRVLGQDPKFSVFLLVLQLANPWQWLCSTRTFSNSLETTLTIMALYYWPWQLLGAGVPAKENPKAPNSSLNLWRLRASLSLAALAVVLRPTNVLIWATLAGVTLARVSLRGPSPLTQSSVLTLVKEAILCGSVIVALSAVSDCLYFGFWTFPPFNFLNFNISQSLAVFYGRNPWHYYILQGLPLLCTTSLPFALQGLYKRPVLPDVQTNALRALSYTILTTVGALSLISHKEARFIYPLLPILNVLATPFAASFFTTTASPPSSASSTKAPAVRFTFRRKTYAAIALAVNILLAGFAGHLHQPAPLNVLEFLREEYQRLHAESALLAQPSHITAYPQDELFALFLMPCHSTPWRSHLIYPNLNAYALSCEPPLHTRPNTPERDNYRDEADRFYDDPIHFLSTELFVSQGLQRPRYIVGFEGIEPWLIEFLATPEGKRLGFNIHRVWDGFNGFFNEDWRRAGRMVVWDTGIHKR